MVDHLSEHPALRHRPCGEPFDFFSSHLVEADLNFETWTLREFRDTVACVDAGSLYLHTGRSRLRKGARGNGFAQWLSDEKGLGLPDLAVRVDKVGQLGLSLEQKRQRILRLCDQELERS